MFLVRAKNSTYITGDNISMSSKLNSHDFCYKENDFMYVDTYLGGEKFIGEEAVWIKDTPVYGMNYYGNVIGEHFEGDFLKEALSYVTIDNPFRGPECYEKGDYIYQCKVQGNLECFQGEEFIYCKQQKIYFCTFHGGILS